MQSPHILLHPAPATRPKPMERLIHLAKSFHQEEGGETPLPTHFASVSAAVEALQQCCRAEAHAGLAQPLDAPPAAASASGRRHFIRAAIDLDRQASGLWTRDGLVVAAAPAKGEKNQKEKEEEERRSRKKKRCTAEEEEEASSLKLKKLQDRAHAQEERKQQQREARKAKKKQKQEEEEAQKNDGGEAENEAKDEDRGRADKDEAAAQVSSHEAAQEEIQVSHEAAQEEIQVSHEAEPPQALATWQCTLNLRRWRRRIARERGSNAAPSTTTMVSRDHTLFASPLPYARSLDALQRCELHPVLRPAMLRGELATAVVAETDGVRIVHGAPGTGKSVAVIRELQELLRLPATGPTSLRRVLVTASSNEAVDRLAEEAMAQTLATSRKNAKPPQVLWTTPRGQKLLREGGRPGRGRLVAFATLGSRNGSRLASIDFDAILVDEAGLVPEFELWGLLRGSTRRLVLVGDHHQLRAVVRHPSHGRSTMQRLVEAGYPCEFLQKQYRMPPELCDFVSRHFYGGRLESCHSGLEGKGVIRVVAIEGGRESHIGTSYANEAEANRAVAIAGTLLRQAAGSTTVAVLAPYAAQRDVVAARLQQEGGDAAVLTVDASQGREFDHVVLTTVRVGPRCGFWADPSRLLVALSRARCSVTVIGDAAGWPSWGGGAHPTPWCELAERAKRS